MFVDVQRFIAVYKQIITFGVFLYLRTTHTHQNNYVYDEKQFFKK